MHPKVLVLLFTISLCLLSCKQTNQPRYKNHLVGRTVEIIEQDGKYQLYRNGEPYFIKGAGGHLHLEKLKKSGGNSIRLYDTKNAREVLDKAQELGLTVTLGLYVAKAITEMDYSNKKAVSAQLLKLKKEVLKYKDHPALLMWAVGNEPTLHVHPRFDKPGSIITNSQTWLAVNEIAKMVHDIDPNHPTTTMLQSVPSKRTTLFIKSFCPDIDVLSFNIFMPLINNVPQLIKERGWDGPYILSEYGTLGYWFNITQTDWYAVYESTSTEKAKLIQETYQKYIQSEKNRCLGSYVFYWGQKQEFTPTWFSLFTEDGKSTEVVDMLRYLWTSKWPANRAPSIQSLRLNQQHPTDNIYLTAGDTFTTTINTQDAEQEKLTLYWEILEDENNKIFDSGYKQEKPRTLDKGEFGLTILKSDSPTVKQASDTYHIQFKAPVTEGPYRIYMFVRDEHDQVATASVPFYVLATD